MLESGAFFLERGRKFRVLSEGWKRTNGICGVLRCSNKMSRVFATANMFIYDYGRIFEKDKKKKTKL